MSSVTNKTELIAGTTIYNAYKVAMHLIDPDDVKEFRGQIRAFRSSMQREIFHPSNEPYIVDWHDGSTAYKLNGWVETGFSDDEKEKQLETFTTDQPELQDLGGDSPKYIRYKKFRKHLLNKRVLSYLYMVEMHLTKFGDQAYANIGTILPNLPEALIGSVTNLKKLDIIEDSNYLRDKETEPDLKPTTIRLHGREVLDLSRVNQVFTEVCWEEFEKLLLDPLHKIDFNKEGRPSIDPVVETQFSHYLGALNDAFHANKIWQVYNKMAGIMQNAEINAQQLQENLTDKLEETLEYIEAYNTRFTREILECAQTTRKFNIMFADVKDNIDIMEEALSENGILDAIAKTLGNMHDEVDFIDEKIDEKLQQLTDTNNYARTAKATLWKRIKEVEERIGGSNFNDLVKLYMNDYKKGNVPSVKDKLAELEEQKRIEEEETLAELEAETEFEEEIEEPKRPGLLQKFASKIRK